MGLFRILSRFSEYIKKCFGARSPLSYTDRTLLAQAQLRKADGHVVSAHSNHEYGLARLSLPKLDLSGFNEMEYIPGESFVTVGSAVTIRQLLLFLIDRGLTLAVIPDLGHLTMGGIVSGIGGGSGSFKNGYFHELVVEMDVLFKTGILDTLKTSDVLFFAVPNTLGTLGYILRMKVKVIPLPGRFVTTENLLFRDWDLFAAEMKRRQLSPQTDFLDGTVFGPSEFVLVVGRYTTVEPTILDNFVNEKIYWHSIRTEPSHRFRLLDFIYRWDTDLYYTTEAIQGLTGRFLRWSCWRRFVPKACISTFKRIVGCFINQGTVRDIMQDVLIPSENGRDFFRWFVSNTPVFPLYICPARTTSDRFLFWPQSDMIDFGIGYGVDTPGAARKTQLIERQMTVLGGRKLLYTRTQLSIRSFWRMYDSRGLYNKIWARCNSNPMSLTTYDKVKYEVD